MKDFSFSNNIQEIQNQLIAQAIRDSSNLELAKTEEAIKSVLKSYLDRFQSVQGMLTDISKYIVESKSIIKLDTFNNLFESIYIDFSALYSNLGLVDNVLNLNLHRNKNFYLNIKKQIRDLWKQVYLLRDSLLDNSLTSESFYESFDTDINSKEINNLMVDKKAGILYINPNHKDLHNKPFVIKTATSLTYPVHNESGGVYQSIDTLNSIIDNFKTGKKDIFVNGLWKEEIVCQDIPSLILNIGDVINKNYKNYNGVVSVVDIEFVHPIQFNRFDVDIFGDSSLLLDAIFIKNTVNEAWSQLYSYDGLPVTGSSFDFISFLNISKTTCRFMRIIFNQKNYVILRQANDSEFNFDKQIQTDLSERRYELISYDKNIYNLGIPNNSSNLSLYNRIINIIETTRDINLILTGIEKLLIPDIKTASYDFSTSYKYEIGAWSIEPSYEKYSPFKGYLISKDYTLKDRSLTSISIRTNQSVPNSSTCNWYVGYNGKNIPILENNNAIRKEIPHFIDMNNYLDYSDWPGSFILLDFPVDPHYIDDFGIYENGIFYNLRNSDVAFLSSRLIYIPRIISNNRSSYVISYRVPLYDCVNLWSLTPVSSNLDSLNNISLGVVSSRRDILQSFINTTTINISGKNTYLSSLFNIENCIALKNEAILWFGSNFNTCLSISSELINNVISFKINPYISINRSKMSGSKIDVESYIAGNGTSSIDYSISSTLSSIVFPNIGRTI